MQATVCSVPSKKRASEEARAILDTNFLGTYLVTRALLPQLRSQGAGHILNMSSGAGIGAVPGLALYSASKFAVEGFSEALAQEIAAFGLRVTIIEPGAFNTGFPSGGIVKTREAIPAYAALTGQLAAGMQHWYGAHGGDPKRAAAAILRVVDEPEPPLRLVLGPGRPGRGARESRCAAQQFRRLGSADAIYGPVRPSDPHPCRRRSRKHEALGRCLC